MNAQIDSINKHHGETILNSTLHSFNIYFNPIIAKLKQKHKKKLSDLLQQKETCIYYRSDQRFDFVQHQNNSKKKHNRKFKRKKNYGRPARLNRKQQQNNKKQ